MRPIKSFSIRPRLPENLAVLSELAYNMWWQWNYEAVDMFRRLSRKLWEQTEENPVQVLLNCEQERLNYLSHEEGFLNHVQRVYTDFRKYITEPRWFQKNFPDRQDLRVAYFSAEFGLGSCVPVYSGGLGILAGDHLKTASDMGLPLVGVGLAYRQGYFHQYLNIDGWQQERYDDNDFYTLPAEPVLDANGDRLRIDIPYLIRPVKAELWRINVGRIPLFLLTTNLQENRPEDRVITDQLYGGDREMRIRQEIVLGIGGLIALRAMGLFPTVIHMNEGHSAFMALERIRGYMQRFGLDFAAAFEGTTGSNVFTTHTPVPAGNDVFANEMIGKYLKPLAEDLKCGWEPFVALGRDHELTRDNNYCMTVAALRSAGFANAVSRLHGRVSRAMWNDLWPQLPQEEVPIHPITNGVHIFSWISHDMGELLERYIGPDWRSDPLKPELWHRIYEIPDEELWRTHETRRARLVAFARKRLEMQLQARGAAPEEIADAAEVLNPKALTIGFGRRFATYKRATLLFRDVERLRKLVNNLDQPVQFIFAGKAHPRDDAGKQLIRYIVHSAHDAVLRHRVVFLEDYDIAIARYMLQGADVWLNTPRRPLEASGTSGMKAVANGGLHLSVLDGWWDQAYHPDYGWAIGKGEEYDDLAYQDEVEGDALYDLLEREVVPQFYERSKADVPRIWVARMKRSMASLLPRFCSHRMVRNYVEDAYLPADARLKALSEQDFSLARNLAVWRTRILQHWDKVRVTKVETDRAQQVLVGEEVVISAEVDCGELTAQDISVEVYFGAVDSHGEIVNGESRLMKLVPGSPQRTPQFSAKLSAPSSGFFGLTVRVFPCHPGLPHKYATYHVTWAE